MQSQSATYTSTTGATVEVGTITHEGREFTNLGSVIDHDNGIVIAYIGTYIQPTPTQKGGYPVTTWNGERIGWAQKVSTWRQVTPNAIFPYVNMTAYRAIINGITYAGRHGDMDLIRLRRCK